MKKILFCLCGVLLMLAGCQSRSGPVEPQLVSINIVDRNGFSETISNSERLSLYANVDFLKPQGFQKVMRVYSRDCNGDSHAYITSYHTNGQLNQYLEVINNRATGAYREWHPNGLMKLDCVVIAGEADLDNSSQTSWLFDGCCSAWDEEGRLEAQVLYEHGELEGLSIYYHPHNGTIWKNVPFHKDKVNGKMEVFLEDGTILQETEYANGEKHGPSKRFWDASQVAADEFFARGRLESAVYYDKSGTVLSKVDTGSGFRAVFGKNCLSELHQYHRGVPEGEVKIFAENGSLLRLYHELNSFKHGEEVEYYSYIEAPTLTPKLSVQWHEGKIQGLVKTWYASGQPEHQREMSNNQKNGVLTAWYPNGNLMLIEEYDHDKLVNGEYFPPGETLPITQVKSGKGTASIFDPKGHMVRKIDYYNSHPIP